MQERASVKFAERQARKAEKRKKRELKKKHRVCHGPFLCGGMCRQRRPMQKNVRSEVADILAVANSAMEPPPGADGQGEPRG